MTSWSRSLLPLLLVSSVTFAALAEEDDPLAQARELFQSFEYDRSLTLLESIVEDAETAAGQRLEALALAGTIHLLRDERDQARSVFQRLLTLDPGYEIDDPDIPPRVRAFFEETRPAGAPGERPRLELELPDALRADEPVRISVSLSGPSGGVETMTLFSRTDPTDFYDESAMTREGDSRYQVTLDPLEGATLWFYVEARAPSGFVLARLGNEGHPRMLRATVAEPTAHEEPEPAAIPWYRRWWLWTIVGAVVVGTVVLTAVFAARPEEHREGSLGSITLSLSSARMPF